MRFDQLEFLRKEFDKVYWRLKTGGTDSSNRSDIMASNIVEIREGLTRMASIFGTALKTIEDEMKTKEEDPWEQEVEELSGTLTRSKQKEDQEARRREFELEYNKAIEIAKGKDWQHAMFQQYGLRDGKPPTGNDAWVIPYCIDELLKANEELKQDTSKLSLGVQKSNRAFMVALRHLMGKTEKNNG